MVSPAALGVGDGDEGRGPQGQAGGARLRGLRLGPAVAVVLLGLPEGQRRQLHTAAGEAAHREGLHAGHRALLRGVRTV